MNHRDSQTAGTHSTGVRPPRATRRINRSIAYALGSLALAAAPVPGSAARAEVIRLKDGSSLEGTLKRTSDGYDVTDGSGVVTHVDADNVKGIELSGKAAPGALEAGSRLASLRRSVENLGDLKAIVERYEHFVEQNKQSPVGKEAERDLAQWRDRQAQSMVKVGSRWVTPEERIKILDQSNVLAEDARQLLRQGRVRDADPILQEVLTNDPANPAAAYLRGIVLFKQEQVPAARKLFDTVVAIAKDHAPGFNNLAVVQWRQNQQVAALNSYVQAMLAQPMDVEVLNNVAEALNALPQNLRAGAVPQKAARVFADQDAALQQAMAQQGWYRWGSTWVDKEQIAKLQAIEKEIQKKLDAMSADYDDLKKRIARIDDDIDDNVRRMKALEETSFSRDAQGNLFRLPLPRRYFELQDDNKRLAADRAALMTKADEMRAAAKQVQQQIPTPRFTGVQRLIGVERAPGLPAMKLTVPIPSPTTPAAAAGTDPRDLRPPEMVPLTPPQPPPSTRPDAPAATRPADDGQRRPLPASLLGG